MPFIYSVYVEYWDENLDRFWFDTEQVVSDEALSRNQIFAEVDQLIAQRIAGPQYESLRDFLEEGDFTPIEQLTSAVFVPP